MYLLDRNGVFRSQNLGILYRKLKESGIVYSITYRPILEVKPPRFNPLKLQDKRKLLTIFSVARFNHFLQDAK
jgi:hypothetical protein